MRFQSIPSKYSINPSSHRPIIPLTHHPSNYEKKQRKVFMQELTDLTNDSKRFNYSTIHQVHMIYPLYHFHYTNYTHHTSYQTSLKAKSSLKFICNNKLPKYFSFSRLFFKDIKAIG